MKNKNLIRIFFTVLLIFSSVVQNRQVVLADQTVSGFYIENIRLTVNGQDIEDLNAPLPQDQNVSMYFDWKIDNDTVIVAGDFLEIVIPEGFRLATSISGNLVMEDQEIIGYFELDKDSRVLRLTVNELAEILLDISGTVTINTRFELDSISRENPVVIEFVISETVSKTFVILFQPSGNLSDLAKSGVANKAINPDQIEWVIDFNRQLHPLESVSLLDAFSSGQSFDVSSFRLYNLQVDLDGNIALGSMVSSEDYELLVNEEARSFTLNLDSVQGAYRIVYVTNIENIDEISFTNEVVYRSLSTNSVVSVNRGSLLEKEGTLDRLFNPNSVTWTIYVNKYLREFETLILKDSIPSGLSFDSDSLQVWEIELDSSGNIIGSDEVDLNDIEITFLNDELEIDLGSTNKAYKILFDTDIVNENARTFENVAYLLDGQQEIALDNAIVSFSRGTAIAKRGTATVNYQTKIITWTIDLNTNEKDLIDVILRDIIGVGHSLNLASVEVFDLTYTPSGTIATSVKVATPPLTITEDPTGFIIELGSFSNAKRIVYSTTITDVNQSRFENTASLEEVDGPILATVTTPVNRSITNNITKTTFSNGINYLNKTMNWRITIAPIKEPMVNLVIRDTFVNDGLSFIQSSLTVRRGSTLLIEDVDYEIELIDNNGRTEFNIRFLNDVSGAEYRIEYLTAFDRLWHATVDNARTYINRIDTTWTEESNGVDRSLARTASYNINQLGIDNGNKSGVLRRYDREIDWTININYLREPLMAVVITDEIVGNQAIKEGSLVLYHVSIQANGSIVRQGIVDPSLYTFDELTNKKFVIRFIDDVVDAYQLVYTTELEDRSQAVYENSVQVNLQVYSASVAFSNHDKFIDKTAIQVGALVEWTIRVNQSLSSINDVSIEDILSIGHQYVLDSFKVYKMPTMALVDPSNYHLSVSILDFATMEQKFIIQFNETIVDEYVIQYQTLITAEVNGTTLGNDVTLSGTGVSIDDSTSITEEIIVEITEGTGTGSGLRHSLRIEKRDALTQLPIQGTKFSLFDANMNLLGELPATDEFGIIHINRMTFGKYFIVETQASEGYINQQDPIEIQLISGVETIVIVENQPYRSVEVVKVDAFTQLPLVGVRFDLFLDDELITSGYTDQNGIVSFQGLLFDVYVIQEYQPLEGYMPNEQLYEIDFVSGEDKHIELLVENEPLRTIEVFKTDADTQRPLQGVEFELYYDETLIATGITNSEGLVSFEGLLFGSYQLVESKPLIDYLPLDGPVNIEVDDTQLVIRIDVENRVDPSFIRGDDDEMPDTSDNRYPFGMNFLLLGIFLLMMSYEKSSKRIKQ